MPTQRAHGGAAVQPINLTSPAFRGLNTENSANLLGPEWATTLDNAVFDTEGRPTTRKGWVSGTTTVYDGTEKLIKRIHEFWKASATSEVISSTDDNILKGMVDLSTSTASIDGSLSITDGNIKFVNFADKCIAFGLGSGGIPVAYTGSGNFGDITVSAGTAPTGTVGLSAFGRLWGVDSDKKTLRWSAILDETKWDSGNGGGSVDFGRAWPSGQDTIVALGAISDNLVVMGRKSAIIIADDAPSALGLDPTQMYVKDALAGVGAISQFAVCNAKGDLWLLTENGITSIGRELVQRTNPIKRPSDNVNTQLKMALDNETSVDDVTLAYHPADNFVLAIFPSSEQVFHFDADPLDDGSNKTTTWTSAVQTSAYLTSDKSLRASLSREGGGSTTGEIYQYSGFSDDGKAFVFDYESGWLDLGQEAAAYLKMVKKVGSVVFASADTSVTHTVKYDFDDVGFATAQIAVAGGTAAEYNIAEYSDGGGSGIGYKDPSNTALGQSEYSGSSLQLRTLSAPSSGAGQYIKVGLQLDNSASEFSVQQINLFAKVGRLAH